jgi:hypothetical protein
MNFKETTRVYTNATTLLEKGIELHYVPSAEHIAFQKALVNLADKVAESEAGSPWDEYLRVVRRINWLFVCSPVAFSTILETRRDKLDQLNGQIICTAFPAVSEAYSLLLKRAKALKALSCNPLAAAIKDWILKETSLSPVLMIVPERAIIQPVRDVLLDNMIPGTWEVLDPSTARRCAPYDCVVFFGPPWFLIRGGHGSLLRSPLGTRLVTFCLSGFRASDIAPSCLNPNSKSIIKIFNEHQCLPDSDVSDSQAELLLPAPRDWSALLRGATQGHSIRAEDITADCRAFVLGGGHMVFLDVDSKRWTVISERTGATRVCTDVRRVKTNELDQGDLILLTTDSAGDMLKPYADQILGNEADEVNSLIADWKRSLHARVVSDGMAATVISLKKLGSSIASPTNVRNWHSEAHIAMDNIECDLGAVLSLIGWDSKKQEVFRAVNMVRKARKEAALLLHRKLLARLQGQNISEVLQSGFMEFRLEDGDVGPSKTVFVIEEIGKEIVTLPSHRVNRVHTFDSEVT